MKTIKQDTCPGLSGSNTLTYELGREPDQTVWLRLVKSSGGGFLHNDWISVTAIMEVLTNVASPFTSWALHTLFVRKSANSPAFLMAVLRQEGLVTSDPDKPQAFVINAPDAALAAFQKRIKGAVSSPKKKTARKPK